MNCLKSVEEMLSGYSIEELTRILHEELDALGIPYIPNGGKTTITPLSSKDFADSEMVFNTTLSLSIPKVENCPYKVSDLETMPRTTTSKQFSCNNKSVVISLAA